MQDSEQQLPASSRNHKQAQEADVTYTDGAYQNEAILPAGRSTRAGIYGILAGVLAAAISTLITYLNASTYQHPPSSSTPAAALQSYAYTLIGLSCLTFFISQLIYFFAGFICGKTLIERKQGFLAGFLGGVVSYAISFILNYVPGFPGKVSNTGAINGQAVASGLVISLIFLLVNGGIGGLFGVFGARIATRRHPYYLPHEDTIEEIEGVE